MNIDNQQDLYLLVMNAPVGICVLDVQTLKAEIVNDSFIAVASKPREAIPENFYWDTFAETRSCYESELAGVISDGNPYFASAAERKLIRHGKKETFYMTLVNAPLKDNAGEVKKVAVWVMDNITV
jgi:hypothetical protein